MSKKSKAELDSYLDVEEQDSRRSLQKHTVRKMFARVARHKGVFAVATGLMLLSTLGTLLEPRVFGYAIDDAIVPKDWVRLQQFAIFYFVIQIVRVVATGLSNYVFTLLGQRVMQDMRLELFSHLQRLPISDFDKNPAGRLVTRLTNDISALAEMFSSGFVMVAGNVIVVAGILAWLLVLSLKLGLIALSVFPVLLVASKYFSGRLRVSYRDARSKLSALNAFLAENIMGIRVVNLFNRQGRHLERFERINQWYSDAQIGTVRVFALFQPTITWCSGIAVALVIAFGGVMTQGGDLKLGVLVAFFSYVAAIFQPVREIADRWNIFLSGMASAERIFSMLDWPTELKPGEVVSRPIDVPRFQGRIVFESVWFAYSGENWVLRDFSLEIAAGTKVGVVGHTGAGKTTLISLLLRFYEPQKGRILIDGRDIREYDKRSLRSAIGIIQQDVFLFSGTIRDNLTLWRGESGSGLTGDGTGALAELGGEIDEGLLLQERGSNLSMGQRQLLAFARALKAKPSVWILDEATANIDTESERRVERALRAASQGATAIMIAHRLATVREADLIIVLHKGVLLEAGRHAELMALDGLYARLYRYQSATEPVGEELRPGEVKADAGAAADVAETRSSVPETQAVTAELDSGSS